MKAPHHLSKVTVLTTEGWQAAVASIAEAVSCDFSWSESLQHYVSQAAYEHLLRRFERVDTACVKMLDCIAR
eukprot:COSAG06_NODE_12294_length_1398_cov_9.431871_1_plen_72_part_00